MATEQVLGVLSSMVELFRYKGVLEFMGLSHHNLRLFFFFWVESGRFYLIKEIAIIQQPHLHLGHKAEFPLGQISP